MWQTETVAGILADNGIKTEITKMETKGDKILDRSIAKIGSKGVFTEELEDRLAQGLSDIAVHSAKDMQSRLPEGFELIAFTEREKVNDVLLSDDQAIDLSDTSRKIVIGTSSVRRRAFLQHYYPHVEAVEMRGNLQTRIKKLESGVCDALMLAYAGVKRMGYDDRIIKTFSDSELIPPVGQGCIAIEASTSLSAEKKERIRTCLNNQHSEACLLAERAFLRKLEGGCSIPAFGLAKLDGSKLSLDGGLASIDGSTMIRNQQVGPKETAEQLGEQLGDYVLENGGRELLEEIRRLQAIE